MITFVFINIKFTENILYIILFQVEKINYVFIPFKILDRVFYKWLKIKYSKKSDEYLYEGQCTEKNQRFFHDLMKNMYHILTFFQIIFHHILNLLWPKVCSGVIRIASHYSFPWLHGYPVLTRPLLRHWTV